MTRYELIPSTAMLVGRLVAWLTGMVLAGAPSVAAACGWTWETYHAEAKSLPCVFDAVLGFWPKHTARYHEIRIEAAQSALRWAPLWTDGLDAKGVSQMKLGRLEEARATMQTRLQIDEDAYPAHANLGTLLTFSGEYDAALEHIDRAMKIEPQAHFGREQYHRALVVFLQRVAADPKVATRENFLGIELTKQQRLHGSKRTYASLEIDGDSASAFDALVSMITVYGADQVPELYLALGELLAARGDRRLAYAAYRRARALGHPRKAELMRWSKALDEVLYREYAARVGPSHRRRHREPRGDYRGISHKFASRLGSAKKFQRDWARWENEALDEGLPIWTGEGLDTIYARMHEKRRRCDAPSIIDDAHTPTPDDPTP